MYVLKSQQLDGMQKTYVRQTSAKADTKLLCGSLPAYFHAGFFIVSGLHFLHSKQATMVVSMVLCRQ